MQSNMQNLTRLPELRTEDKLQRGEAPQTCFPIL